MPDTSIAHRPAKNWLKIVIDCPPAASEIVAAFLAALTDSGIELAAADDPAAERLIGYLPEEAESGARLAELTAFLNGLPDRGRMRLETERIVEQDWGEAWKKHFKPLLATPRLAIKPSWEEYRPRQGERIIEIDPGMAFGTGLHASTRLCLELIDECYPAGGGGPRRALDVGTGTGILAMACSLLGAQQVTALDNDPDAVFAAAENVRRNHLDALTEVSGRDVATLPGPFDLVIANIIFETLLQLAPAFRRLLPAGGRLILAGILRGEQEAGIAAAYAAGFEPPAIRRYREEWAAFRLTRAA